MPHLVHGLDGDGEEEFGEVLRVPRTPQHVAGELALETQRPAEVLGVQTKYEGVGCPESLLIWVVRLRVLVAAK